MSVETGTPLGNDYFREQVEKKLKQKLDMREEEGQNLKLAHKRALLRIHLQVQQFTWNMIL